MIEKNLGNIERVFRLLLAAMFAMWVLSRPDLNAVEWFVMIISMALFLNGVFSRCYLWYVLDINTCRGSEADCYTDPHC